MNANIDIAEKFLRNNAPDLLDMADVIATRAEHTFRHQYWAFASYDECLAFETSFMHAYLQRNGGRQQ